MVPELSHQADGFMGKDNHLSENFKTSNLEVSIARESQIFLKNDPAPENMTRSAKFILHLNALQSTKNPAWSPGGISASLFRTSDSPLLGA